MAEIDLSAAAAGGRGCGCGGRAAGAFEGLAPRFPGDAGVAGDEFVVIANCIDVEPHAYSTEIRQANGTLAVLAGLLEGGCHD